MLELRFVSKSYGLGDSEVRVLSNLNFKISDSEVVAVIGPSGSGKTTFLQIAGLLDAPSSGDVLFSGECIALANDDEITRIRGHDIGFIYQFHNLMPELDVLENIALPLLIHNASKEVALKKARKLAVDLGVGHRLKHLPHQLSGGEQQRVAIARALIMKPKLILADEPTGNLDEETAKNMIDIIMLQARERKIATVIVTHNIAIAKRADRVVTIAQMQKPKLPPLPSAAAVIKDMLL